MHVERKGALLGLSIPREMYVHNSSLSFVVGHGGTVWDSRVQLAEAGGS